MAVLYIRNSSGEFEGVQSLNGKTAYQAAKEGGYTGTESEFNTKLAQEIPTALPNPQPITINGQRYDGSDAVTVTTAEIDDTLTQSGKAADAKAVGDRLNELNKAYVTPQMFGAFGDGMADDSNAFLEAIATKKELYIPNGTYFLSSFDISAYAYDGLKIVAANNAIIHCNSGLVCDRDFGNKIKISISGLNIVGDKDGNDTTGVFIHSGSPAFIENCTISGFHVGIRLRETYDCRIDDTKIKECSIGIYYDKSTYANSVNTAIVQKTTIYNADIGIYTEVGANNTFDHISFEYCKNCFTLNDSPTGYLISNCYAEGHKSFVIANNSAYSSSISIIGNFLGDSDETPEKYMIRLRNCTGLTIQRNIVKLLNGNYFVSLTDKCEGLVKENVLRDDGTGTTKSLYGDDYLPFYYSGCDNLTIPQSANALPLISASEKTIEDFHNTEVQFKFDKSVLGVNCYTPDSVKTCVLDIKIEKDGWYTATFIVKTLDSAMIGIRNSQTYDNSVENKVTSFSSYARHTVTRYFLSGETARVYIYGVSSYGFLGLTQNCTGIRSDFYLIN